MLNRLLSRNNWDRGAFRIDNICRCQPPRNWFDPRAPWYFDARAHCTAAHLSRTLAEPHKVIVALGGTAARHLLGMDRDCRVEDFHGTVNETQYGSVVPTFHPSHLQRGAHNLFGVVSFDLQRAHQVAASGWEPDPAVLVVDPELAWFTWWVEQVEAASLQDPELVWLTVDIETPDKSSGQDEGELSSEDRSYTILRVNFAVHPDEGVTVPYTGPYIPLIDRLLKLPCVKTGWNFEYDRPRILTAGHQIQGVVLDGMWYAHFLQSDIPRGLGFWAPFYSRWGAWKHRASAEPGPYGACDGFQNWRTVDGVARHLQQLGMWDRAFSHITQLHDRVLRPAQEVGLRINRQTLVVFIDRLEKEQARILKAMQALVPEAVRPLTGNYKHKPEEGKVHAKATGVKRDGTKKKEQPDPIKAGLYSTHARLVHRRVQALVWVCRTCQAVDVGVRHRCARGGDDGVDRGAEARVADLARGTVEVDRWFWQEPFNPDSPQQILAYLAFKGHKPGRAKKTGADSTDRDTLTRLVRETKDPLYQLCLDNRGVGKVKGTYGVGTLKRLDENDRVHPVPTFKPSTMRLSYRDPNVTNCIAQGTPIEVLRDVALWPKGIPIEQVREGDWAYCYDEGRRLTLRRVRRVLANGTQRVVRVHWRGSRRRRMGGYLDLTPDHEVRLTTGEYRAAGLLRHGDRVLSLARVPDKQKGYTLLCATGWMQNQPEHRYAYCEITGTRPGHVHHKNERKLDNRFDNLVGLGVGEHFRLHNTGSGNPRWHADWPTGPHARRNQASVESRARRRAEDPEAFLRQQRETKRAWYQANRSVAARLRNNHEIVAVELLPDPVPVYDLTIDGVPNFIAGELCVHNCVADKDGEETLAAGFRSCVEAGSALPGWVTEEGLAAWEERWNL